MVLCVCVYVLFITRLEVIQYNVIGHNRLNTPIASAYAVIRLHTSVKSSSNLLHPKAIHTALHDGFQRPLRYRGPVSDSTVPFRRSL